MGMRQRTEEEKSLGWLEGRERFTGSTEGPRESRGPVSGQGGLTEFLKKKGQVWAVRAKSCLQASWRLLILRTKSGVRVKGPEEVTHVERRTTFTVGPGLGGF